MGVFGIASSILGQIASAANQNSNKQQIKQGFQLLGQDLQSGNLSQAQSDFSSLQQLFPVDSKALCCRRHPARRAAVRWLPPFRNWRRI